MTKQEAFELQVGDLIRVAGQDARVEGTFLVSPDCPNELQTNGEVVVVVGFSGQYLFTEKMLGDVPGWIFTTDDKINEKHDFMNMENVEPIEIERLDTSNLHFEDPTPEYKWVHTWQNRFSGITRCSTQWKLKD